MVWKLFHDIVEIIFTLVCVYLCVQIWPACTSCSAGCRMAWRQCVSVWAPIWGSRAKLWCLRREKARTLLTTSRYQVLRNKTIANLQNTWDVGKTFMSKPLSFSLLFLRVFWIWSHGLIASCKSPLTTTVYSNRPLQETLSISWTWTPVHPSISRSSLTISWKKEWKEWVLFSSHMISGHFPK